MRLIKSTPKGTQRVYDIEVADVHNFYANGVNVHNCATAAGVSIIKDDGTVESTDNANITRLGFAKGDRLAYGHRGGAAYQGVTLNVAPIRNSIVYGWYINSVIPSLGGSNISDVASAFHGVGDGDVYAWGGATGGIRRINENITSSANGMANYITSSYNTGWMHGDIKGAWLSDTSTASVTGTELVTNGTFASNVTGWTAYTANGGSIAWQTGGYLRISNADATDPPVYAYQAITTVVGQRYILTAQKVAGIDLTAYVSNTINTSPANISTQITWTSAETGIKFTDFIASATTTYVILRVNANTIGTVDVDNVSTIFAEPDRSTNAKGLAVYGTLTKTAVATGSNLVAYSGFSGSNYLVQPYNSALAVGTGDICFMGWCKTTVSGNYELLFDYGVNLSNEFRVYIVTNGQGILLQATANSFSTYDSIATTINLLNWTHLTIIRRNLNNYQVYANGVLVQNSTLSYFTTFSNSGNNSPLHFGDVSSGNISNASMALWRVSASVPSPEQIKKIYEDEKMLFQENSQATLYGASDAVTALAYDDTTDLLSVGTSSGRSDFQGLRRINNTTTAVTTAISASNGLVAEQ